MHQRNNFLVILLTTLLISNYQLSHFLKTSFVSMFSLGIIESFNIVMCYGILQDRDHIFHFSGHI